MLKLSQHFHTLPALTSILSSLACPPADGGDDNNLKAEWAPHRQPPCPFPAPPNVAHKADLRKNSAGRRLAFFHLILLRLPGPPIEADKRFHAVSSWSRSEPSPAQMRQ